MVALHPERRTQHRDEEEEARAKPPLELVRRDTLPEHTNYRDLGCEVSPSCLLCPLERCKYDVPLVSERQTTMHARDQELVRRRRRGAAIDSLAVRYRLSRRTIFRILSEARD